MTKPRKFPVRAAPVIQQLRDTADQLESFYKDPEKIPPTSLAWRVILRAELLFEIYERLGILSQNKADELFKAIKEYRESLKIG